MSASAGARSNPAALQRVLHAQEQLPPIRRAGDALDRIDQLVALGGGREVLARDEPAVLVPREAHQLGERIGAEDALGEVADLHGHALHLDDVPLDPQPAILVAHTDAMRPVAERHIDLDAALRELVAEGERLLDTDGRPRTKIRQRGD